MEKILNLLQSDVSSNTWKAAHLSEPRKGLLTATVGNKVFFTGGSDYDDGYVLDIYDVSTDTWTVAAMNTVKHPGSATVAGNKVYFADKYSNNIDIYTIMLPNTWSSSTLQYLKGVISAIAQAIKFIGWAERL